MNKTFTFTRYIADDGQGKADALLFSQEEQFSKDQILKMLDSKPLLDVCGTTIGMIVFDYYKSGTGEHRAVFTRNTFYCFPFNDTYASHNVNYFKNDGPEFLRYNYGSLLDSCDELYRDAGPEPCYECPKKGKECISSKFYLKEDNWPFILPALREGAEANGLLYKGPLAPDDFADREIYAEREAYTTTNSLPLSTENLVKVLTEHATLCDFKFLHPDETQVPDGKPISTKLLRLPKYHRMH
jgi:hypothetical protein